MKKLKIMLPILLILLLMTAPAMADEAENLTDGLTVKVVDKAGKVKAITDGSYKSFWESSSRKEPWVVISSDKPIYGLYLCFQKIPDTYVIQKASGEDWVTVAEGGNPRYHHVFFELDGLKKIRILSTMEKKNVMGFNEIYAFGQGEVPDWVQRWEAPVEKADLLFLIAHPDDELLFTGGAIPTYAVEKGKSVEVAYLSFSNTTRRSEALNGLWAMGVRNYPVFGPFADRYAKTGKLKDAYAEAGGKQKVFDWVNELYRRFRPEVVVTHAENGEYGHPQHKMIADAAKECFTQSGLVNITLPASAVNIEDGAFLAWEGCNNLRGSCLGTCTHVWNYAQTAAFLFPDLEVSARYNEFELETEADGKMNFRATKALNQPSCNLPAASDGQCGTIVRLLREWRMTGDNHIIDDLGAKALDALEYCIRTWDPDRDGVAEGEQHNTYDIEFYGVNPLGGSMYLAALHAGAQIAEYLKLDEKAAEYEAMYTEGSCKLDKLLWNGEYYIQKISAEEMLHNKYQYGDGCLSDQLMGQYMAFLTGMGYIMPEENVKKAYESILRYNYRDGLEDFANPFRVYALNDEAGLLLCTWPHGGRPNFPFYFCDEIWTGIEYQIAACLIWSGKTEEGLKNVTEYGELVAASCFVWISG